MRLRCGFQMLSTAEEWIERLDLKPLEIEGGFYRETFRSDEVLEADALPVRYRAPRALYTSIYYLLTPDSFSAIHRVNTDEIFHFYAGHPVTMVQLYETGTGRVVRLHNSGDPETECQVHVPRRVWQGCHLDPGGTFALLGCTLAPGFDRLDFEEGQRSTLIKAYPSFKFRIMNLTRIS